MGYFGCNQMIVSRQTVRGNERVIVAMVKHDDVGEERKWEQREFPGWESLPEAVAWAQSRMAQLSM